MSNATLMLAEVTLVFAAMPPWIDEVVTLLLKAFGAALVVLVGLAVRKLARKLGIEETAGLERLIQDRARMAVREAEEWAKRQSEKPTGKDKLERALRFIQDLDEPLGLTDTLRKKSEAFVHAALNDERLTMEE